MKICLIGKYFPIQGGVSKDNQWLSYVLAQAGWDVHVVTNAEEVEPAYRCLPWSAFPPLPEHCSGRILVHSTAKAERRHYIPYANPFVTKLATIATDVVTNYGCDMIYSYYLEPYAMAGYLAAQWTGVPFGLRHAGSDVGSLFQSLELQTAYRQVMLAADYVVTTPATYRSFLHLGVLQEKLYLPSRSSVPTPFFSPDASPLDINAYLVWLRERLPGEPYYEVFRRFLDKPFDPAVPTIGIYGKVGEVKGSFDLLHALTQLHSRGERFNLLALVQGNAQVLAQFAERVEAQGLAEVTWLLPFLPHWDVPHFLRACTAICFLERDFPIPIHTPLIPREVLACGTCLILSHEVAAKQPYRQQLSHGANVFLVDPHHHDELADIVHTIIEQPTASQQTGHKGYEDISRGIEDFAAYAQGWPRLFQQIHQDITQRKTLMSAAEMQTLLARLYTEDALRRLFALAPEEVFPDYLLTKEEQEALLRLDQKLLQYFATSLKMKQRERLREAYPATFMLPHIQRYFERFTQLSPAKPHEDFFVRLKEFGGFIEQCYAAESQAPVYASEIPRYERLFYIHTNEPLLQDAFAAINEQPASAQPLGLESVPILLPGVRLETFRYPIVQIVEALRAQQPLEEVEPSEHALLFHRAVHSLHVEVFALNADTAQVLALCDGTHSVASIILALEQTLGEEALADEILSLLESLQMQHILGEGERSHGE